MVDNDESQYFVRGVNECDIIIGLLRFSILASCFVIYWGNGESPLSLKIETRLHINKALLLSTAKQLFEVTSLGQYVFHVFHWVCKMLVR